MTSQAPLLELSATGCAYDEIPVVSNVSFSSIADKLPACLVQAVVVKPQH